MTAGYLASFEPAMRLALDQAARSSVGGDDADVPVGAVVLDGAGSVVGLGRNRREADGDPTAHAEIVAIRQAAMARRRWRLDGCTLVVTLEPCTMCRGDRGRPGGGVRGVAARVFRPPPLGASASPAVSRRFPAHGPGRPGPAGQSGRLGSGGVA